MGYHSDVIMVFYARAEHEGKFPVIKLWFDENYPIAEAKFECDADITYGDDHVMVKYHDVKWYSGYPHVEAVRRVVNTYHTTFTTGENATFAAYEEAVIGEEDQDISTARSTYADHRLSLIREAVFR